MEIRSQVAELTSLCNLKEQGSVLPVPNYIFVDRYGRHAVEFIDQFKELTDKDVFFEFHENSDSDKTYVRTLTTAMEVRAKLGKAYDGMVIVKLDSFDGSDNATSKLIEFMEKKKQEIYFIFELENEREYDIWNDLLKKHFYIRKLQPENFSADEQIQIVEDQLASVNYVMDSQAGEMLKKWLCEHSWEKDDYVKMELERLVKDSAYESAINGQQEVINADLLETSLSKIEKREEKKQPIGFVLS